MRAVLFVVTLLAAVSLSSSSQCQWGPSFWCLNTENAEKCGQVRYCQENIWAPQKVETPKNGIECEVCKILVTFLDKFVDSNSTEEEAQAMAEKFCSVLGSFEVECKNVITNFFPTIWKLLEDEMEPDKICGVIKMCSESDLVKVATPESADLCDICKMVVTFADKFIDENSTEAVAEALAEKMCSALGSLEAECKTLIKEFFPMIWKMLENEADPDTICEAIGLCPKSVVKVATPESADLCDICKLVVTFADKFIDEKSTEEEAEAIVERLCSALGELEAECKSLVEEFFPMIWKMLINETDPDTICKLLGLCTNSDVAKVQAPQGVVTCTVCKLVVKFVEPYFENNKTENETKEALEEMCSHLGNFADECKTLVDEYFPLIWEEFQKETDPEEICTILGLCSSSLIKDEGCDVCKDIVEFLQVYVDNNDTEEALKEKLESFCKRHPDFSDECGLFLENFHELWTLLKKEMDNDELCYQLGVCASLAKPPTKSSPSDLCSMCKLVVSFIAPYVENNATKEEVLKALDTFCGLLPGEYGEECKSFVDSYFNYVWALMESELDNDEICFQLELCSSDKPKVAVETPGGDIECDMCDLMVKFLRPFVDGNSSEDDVKKALEVLCNLLPSKYKEECNTDVQKYFDLIWSIMKQEVNDGELCCFIQLCQNCSSSAPNTQVTMKVEKPEFILCELCELIMEKLESMLVNNATEKDIIELVDKICDILPEIVRKDCEDFINKYGKEIIQGLVDGLGAKAICVLIHACLAEEQQTSQGPSDDAASSFSFNMKSPPEREKIDTCDVCEFAVETLKDLLKDNYTEGAIVEALNLVCSKFPSGLTAECKAFVDEYAPAIIQLIDKDIDAKKLCELIDACPKTTSPLAQPWKMIQKARNMLQ